MWFYIQMWIPLLPIVYVVSCAIDQQTKPHVRRPPRHQEFFRVTSTNLCQCSVSRVTFCDALLHSH